MSVLSTKLRRDLGRSKTQFIAIAVTIFLGITLFGGSFDAYRSLQASYDRMYQDLSFADFWMTGGDVDAFAATATTTPGVDRVETRHEADVAIRPVPTHPVLGRIVGLPPERQPAVNAVMVLDGSYLKPDTVLVEHHMSEHFDLGVGDTVQIADSSGNWHDYSIAGIVASAEYVWPAPSRQQIFTTPDDFGVVFLSDQAVSDLAGSGARAQAMVRFSEDAPADLAGRLEEMALADGAAGVLTQADQPSNSALQEDVKGFGELAFMFPVLFLSAAGLGAWVMLTRLVMTQLSVIGTLMANGMSRRRIFGHYLSYGVVVGLVGAVPGVIAGAFLAWGIAGLYTSAISVPITVVTIDWTTPAQGLVFGLVAGLIAAALPAWRAIRLSPAEALIGSRPSGVAKPTILERLIPPLRRLSTERALVLRNVFRNRRRTITTMLGVVLALTLILVSWGMIDTVQVLLARQFGGVERSDARAVLVQPADTATLSALEAIAGVEAAEPTVSIAVTLDADGEQYPTFLQGFKPGTTMHGFLGPDGELALPDEGVLLGNSVHDLYGVDVGDQITIRIPALDVSVTEEVAGFVSEPLGTFAYVSTDHLVGLLASGRAGTQDVAAGAVEFGAALRLDEAADFESIRIAAEGVPGVVVVTSTRALEDMINSFMGFFYTFVGVMLAFGGMLAFGIIFNTMTVNLSERQVEVATMEAAGMTEHRIARLITAENVVVTLLGIVPGLLVGYAVAAEFMSEYTNDQFKFDLSMRWTTLALSALFIVVVTLISQRPGLRAIKRLNIAEIVRERAV